MVTLTVVVGVLPVVEVAGVVVVVDFATEVGLAAIAPTHCPTGSLPDSDPRNEASPKGKTPPSLAANQYPRPSALTAMPVIVALGWARCDIDPKLAAPPKAITLPFAVTSQ